MKENKIHVDLTPKQTQAYKILQDESKSEILFDGGVRAGKTHVVIFWLSVFCLTVPDAWILIGRRFFEHARKSLYLQTIEPLLSKFPSKLYSINKSDWIIRFKNGSQLWLGGFDDTKRVTEIMGREYLIIFLNEATEIDVDMVTKVKTRLAQKVRKKDGSYYAPKLIFDCNPVADEQFWLNLRFPENDPDKARLRWTVYDNIQNLTEEYIRQLEKELSPEEKLRLVDGLWVGTGEKIYSRLQQTDNYDRSRFTHLVGGIDWGYTSAFNLWGINGQDAICILEKEVRDKITTEFLEEIEIELNSIGINKGDFVVYADHEPDRITEAIRKGFKVKNAFKDVAAGDNTVNWFNTKILNKCTNTWRSMNSLRNKKDRNGVVIEGKHIESDDHSSDSSRYALHSYRMEYGEYIKWKDIEPVGKLILDKLYKKNF